MPAPPHWKIGTRLSLGFGLVIATAVGLAIAGVMRRSDIRASVERLTSEQLVKHAGAAESLREQASHLANLVGSFKPTHATGVA